MISSDHFRQVLAGLSDLLPYSRQLSPQALLLAWAAFPEQAKGELTNAHWTYAATQLLLDPERPREQPPHLTMLRYLYRLEFGQPNLAWGLKADLHERMAQAGIFHPQPIPPADLPPAEHDGARHETGGIVARLNGLLPSC